MREISLQFFEGKMCEMCKMFALVALAKRQFMNCYYVPNISQNNTFSC